MHVSLRIPPCQEGEFTESAYTILAVAWSPDGGRLAVAGKDGRVAMYGSEGGWAKLREWEVRGRTTKERILKL
jgi:hypothetical protein